MIALVTGAYGQDGSFLCEQLCDRGYEVIGVVKEELSQNSKRIKKELNENGIFVEERNTNLDSYSDVCKLIEEIKPNEIYHMAASHLSSEDSSIHSERCVFEKNIKATSNLLEACYSYSAKTHVVTAGSCLMYDNSDTKIQTEETAFSSNSYYGIAKITENMLVRMFRDKGLFACSAILYNHESHRRSDKFVTKKIINNLLQIKNGKKDEFVIGSLDTKKDWGYAEDYANGMILMGQAENPKDYILSSGSLHTIEEFVSVCADYIGIYDWKKRIKLDEKLVSRQVKTILQGDSTLARSDLGWKPNDEFEVWIKKMVDNTVRYE